MGCMKLLLTGATVAALGGLASADQTATSPTVHGGPPGWQRGPGRNTVLVLESTETALPAALTALGVGFDEYWGLPWNVDLVAYRDVFVGMDGGLLEASDIQPLADYATAGGFLHFYGGTCWQDFAVAMNTYLVPNDTNNYCWTWVYGQPNMIVINPDHILASALPPTYNWENPSASFYQFRATAWDLEEVARNGDGYSMLFAKTIGTGRFDYCIDSPYALYYGGQDLSILTQIVSNMLLDTGGIGPLPPDPTQESSWGMVKEAFR